MKKFLSVLLAAVMAFGAAVVFPTGFADISAAVSAAGKTTKDGFILKTDSGGLTYISGYTGKGGDITIPADVDYIGAQAFMNNSKITSVTVPADCRCYFETYCFNGCENLKTVTVKGDIEYIDKFAFSYCENLETVTFGGNVCGGYRPEVSHGGLFNGAFGYCPNLKKVVFSNPDARVDEIGAFVFTNCYSLSYINLPENLLTLYYGAFLNCFSLVSLTVPAGTAFVYKDTVSPYFYGYGDGYKTRNEAEADPLGMELLDQKHYIKLDGKNTIYVTIYANDTKVMKYTPKAAKMIVTKGSDAEKYAKKYDIDYEYAGSAKLAAPTGFRTSDKTEDSFVLSWDPVPGADTYRVYLYNESTGKYEKYKVVSAAKCTIKDLESGTKYKIKVTSLDKQSDGKYKAGNTSKAVSVTTK